MIVFVSYFDLVCMCFVVRFRFVYVNVWEFASDLLWEIPWLYPASADFMWYRVCLGFNVIDVLASGLDLVC